MISAAATIFGRFKSGKAPREKIASATATAPSVAATTAMPPPCGVGVRCDERAFGLASA